METVVYAFAALGCYVVIGLAVALLAFCLTLRLHGGRPEWMTPDKDLSAIAAMAAIWPAILWSACRDQFFETPR